MKPVIKALWLSELQSGQHTQVGGYLHEVDADGNTVGMCCLGVLCALAVKCGVDLNVRLNEKCRYTYNGHESTLPIEVREWAGIDCSLGDFENGGRPGNSLAEVNDESWRSGMRRYEAVIPCIKEYF